MKRIMVVGKSGSGKTVFSEKLSKSTGIKVVHLDRLYYNPDWSHAYTKDEFTTVVNNIIKEEEWIIDGNYSRTMDERVGRADTIIFFDTPLIKSLFYVVKRVLFPPESAPDKHEGMKDKIGWKMLRQMSTYPTRMVMDKISQNAEAKVHIVKNHKEADELLNLLS